MKAEDQPFECGAAISYDRLEDLVAELQRS